MDIGIDLLRISGNGLYTEAQPKKSVFAGLPTTPPAHCQSLTLWNGPEIPNNAIFLAPHSRDMLWSSWLEMWSEKMSCTHFHQTTLSLAWKCAAWASIAKQILESPQFGSFWKR